MRDVFQYLHAGKKDGTPYIHRGNNIAWVYFVGGRIVRAARPGMRNLEDLLLRQRHITNGHLMSAVQIHKARSHAKPLGMILRKQLERLAHE